MVEHRSGSVQIVGTGSYLPDRILTNDDLAQRIDTSDEWVFSRLGVRQRHIASDDQASSDLAAEAGQRAIADAGLTPKDIGLVIVATATPDRLSPSTACITQYKLGIPPCPAFDVSAVCSGFVYGLTVASHLLLYQPDRHALVVGADTFSRITDWGSRDAVFFGDGAGAVVLAPCSPDRGLLAYVLGADGRGWENFTVPAGGSEIPATKETVAAGKHFFIHNGKAVYETASVVLPKAILQVLDRAGLGIQDVSWVVPHQPSVRILKNVADTLGLPFSKVLTNMDRCANTAGACIPLVLDQANRQGKFERDDIVVFAGVGAGWTWGTAVLRWGEGGGKR